MPFIVIGVILTIRFANYYLPDLQYFKVKIEADVRLRDEEISWDEEAYCWPRYISYGWAGPKHRSGFQISPRLLRKHLDDGSVVVLRLLSEFCSEAGKDTNVKGKEARRIPAIEWFDRESSPKTWWLFTDLISGDGGSSELEFYKFEVSKLNNWVTGRELKNWVDGQIRLYRSNDISRIDTSWWIQSNTILPVVLNDIFWERHERPICENQDQFVEIVNLAGAGSLEQIVNDGGVPQDNEYLQNLPVRSWSVVGVFHLVTPLVKNGDQWVLNQKASGSAVTEFSSSPTENVLRIQFPDGRMLEAKRMHLYFDCLGKNYFKVSA